jgi:hypothetical protein
MLYKKIQFEFKLNVCHFLELHFEALNKYVNCVVHSNCLLPEKAKMSIHELIIRNS